MKKKLFVNSIYVTIFAVLAAWLIWYGAQTSFEYSVDLQGGEPIVNEISESPSYEVDAEPFPAYDGEQNPTVPPPVELSLPSELVLNAVYRFDSVCAVFDADGVRIYNTDDSISLNCTFSILSDTMLLADYQGDAFLIVVGYRAVRIESQEILQRFGIENPMNPHVLELSLRD